MEGLQCTACKITLTSQEECRAHYKSAFHTYNLKRKLVSLEPVSLETFGQRQQEAEALASSSSSQVRCDCCGKTFNSAKLYEKHMQNQQYKARSAAPAALEEDCSTTCLFCNLVSESIEENLQHMLHTHGFFVPDIENVIHLEGLLGHLQSKIRVGLMCIYCNNVKAHSFKTPQAVQQHMLDKQHTFVNTEDDPEEFSEFYDWGEDVSYELLTPSEEEVKAEHYIDIDSLGSDSSFSHVVVPKQNAFINVNHFGELKLSHGRIAGNKQFARYYRQQFRFSNRHQELKAVMAQEYKALQAPAIWKTKNFDFKAWKGHQKDSLAKGMKNNLITTNAIRD